MTSHKINFTLPDMPNSINFQISFTVNSEESEPMLDVKHSTVNTQEVINLQDKSSDLDVKPLSSEDPISLDECFENVSLCDKTKKDYKLLIKQHMGWVSVYGVWISQRAITQTARAPLRAHARGSSPMILFVFSRYYFCVSCYM